MIFTTYPCNTHNLNTTRVSPLLYVIWVPLNATATCVDLASSGWLAILRLCTYTGFAGILKCPGRGGRKITKKIKIDKEIIMYHAGEKRNKKKKEIS